MVTSRPNCRLHSLRKAAFYVTLLCVLAFALLTLAAGTAGSTELSGTITASVLSTDTRAFSAHDPTRARFYTTLVGNALGVGWDQLSIHAEVSGSSDFAAGPDWPRSRVARCYLQWKPRAFRGDLRLGRLYVYGGLPLTIDGLAGTVRLGRSVSLYATGGAVVPVTNSPQLGKWEDAHFISASVRGLELPATKVALGFWRRTNVRGLIPDIPVDSEWNSITSDDLAEQTFFLESASELSTYADLDASLEYDEPDGKLRKVRAKSSLRLSERAHAEPYLLYRRPYIDANSIFSVFPSEPSWEYGLGLRYLVQGATCQARYGYIKYSEDSSNRLSVGARYRDLSLNLALAEGYGGDAAGLTGSYVRRIWRTVTLRPTASYTRYRFGGLDNGKNSEYWASINLSAKLVGTAVVDVVGQAYGRNIRPEVRDGATGYEHDLRLVVRVRYAFGIRETVKQPEVSIDS